ncbi:hypothetical protein AVEN_253740-1 [Araneus ventricosus]|uniref:Uncharacterized protein n=1 Tax=Araneus ventricosus TaxID=182803 RepID=A0A4Y2DYR5_ARAVE|nr:hypothetical protein AVEN_253740-1 [Araneus ventricosus]
MNHSCKSGSKHLLERNQKLEVFIRRPEKGGESCNFSQRFMSHPEYLLLSMLAEERRHIRELGVRRIIKERGSSSTVERRRFVIPKLNFKANQYIDMIDWLKCDVTEPLITADLTVEELKSIAENGSTKDL